MELFGDTVRAYVDGAQIIEATNLTSPPGLFGLFAYREDIILDKIDLDVIRTTAPLSTPPPSPPTERGLGVPLGIPLSSPWVVAPIAFFLGVATMLVASKVFPRLQRVKKRP